MENSGMINCSDKGSQMKMREACQKMLDLLTLRGDGKAQCVLTWDEFNDSQKMLRAALSEPPRQCDVGTAKEQADRYLRFCRIAKPRVATCDGCPLANTNAALCEFAWAQTPYEKEGVEK